MALKPQFLKIVYFDEGSALDYLEAKHGGRYDKVSSDIIQRVKKIAGEVGGEASTDPKILSFVVDSLLGIKGRISGSASYGRTGENKVSETVSSTVLSNFIEDVYKDRTEQQEEMISQNFGIFEKVKVSFVPNSVTFLKIISPMLKIIKEESFGNDMPINLGALDQIFSDAKGYYELVSVEEEKQKKVFRFNFNALRNNYRLNDLTKMDITIIGIKVGECTEAELEWEAEFDDKKVTDHKSSFEKIVDNSESDTLDIVEDESILSIYDVILAGVTNNDN